MPIALDGIRTCISGIRAHRASDCTTTAGTPPVSRNKHFTTDTAPRRQARLPSVETNTSDTHPSARVCVCVCVCVCVIMKLSARRMASMTSDTGETSSKQQQAHRKQKIHQEEECVCVYVCACARACVRVCHNEKKCQAIGKHGKRQQRYFKYCNCTNFQFSFIFGNFDDQWC